MADTNGKSWAEHLRVITPIMIFGLGIYVSFVKSDIRRVETAILETDRKIFMHFTNDEIHTPKASVVTKPEFQMYQAMRDKQMDDVKDLVDEIKDIIKKK